MISSSSIEIRRCRPLLGTFVEITGSGLDEAGLHQAIDEAFSAIEAIHQLLSVHDAKSELSFINRKAARQAVSVSKESFNILHIAHGLAKESDGAFDYTTGSRLASWGLLPKRLQRKNSGNWRDVLLLSDRKIRFQRALTIDLGGIAKGYAVDAAMKILQKRGLKAAMVNAGGDLRVFGAEASKIHLRHPSRPNIFAHTLTIRSSALATSSPCFTEKIWQGQRVSHLVNSRNERPITGSISVTVRAPACWLADALTKVVLNSPRSANRLLAKYGAEALVLTA